MNDLSSAAISDLVSAPSVDPTLDDSAPLSKQEHAQLLAWPPFEILSSTISTTESPTTSTSLRQTDSYGRYRAVWVPRDQLGQGIVHLVTDDRLLHANSPYYAILRLCRLARRYAHRMWRVFVVFQLPAYLTYLTWIDMERSPASSYTAFETSELFRIYDLDQSDLYRQQDLDKSRFRQLRQGALESMFRHPYQFTPVSYDDVHDEWVCRANFVQPSSYYGEFESIVGRMQSMILPSVALALDLAAHYLEFYEQSCVIPGSGRSSEHGHHSLFLRISIARLPKKSLMYAEVWSQLLLCRDAVPIIESYWLLPSQLSHYSIR